MAFAPNVTGLQHAINRAFDSMMQRTPEFDGETLCDWTPRVDIVERENEYAIVADLPGVDRKDIHVNVEKNTLSISGERPHAEQKDDERWYRAERARGTFKRVFSLPRAVDPSHVSAQYKNGVLTVSVPKAEEAKPRQIDVKID